MSLRFAGNSFKIPVVFIIQKIDFYPNVKQLDFQFSYAMQNITKGIQKLNFKEMKLDSGEVVTKLTQDTYYKSNYYFRDKLIYPPLHRLTLNDYHRNMNKRLKPKSSLK